MVNGEAMTMQSECSIVNANRERSEKPLSQAAIGRELGLAPSTMTKHKAAGMPMDSVESARAWHKAHTNIAQRKPASRLAALACAKVQAAPVSVGGVPGVMVNPITAASMPDRAPPTARQDYIRVGGDDFRDMIRANEVRPDGGPLFEDFDSARTREKIAAANLAEMEEAAMRGMYLVKTDFERHLFNAGRMLRDTLTNCARRIGAEVSGLSTAEQCESVIDREHRAALASFSQQLRITLKVETENNPLNAPVVPQ